MRLNQRRRTPWDHQPTNRSRPEIRAGLDRPFMPDSSRQRAGRMDVICLHGLYVFDPSCVTSEDCRQFMWAGLHVLREGAKAAGLSEEQIRAMLCHAFDAFHDTADDMWLALKKGISVGESKSLPCEGVPVISGVVKNAVELANDPFVACEEDRPVSVKARFKRPLTFLDPDAEILASFEP
jgi:hypothetical protein